MDNDFRFIASTQFHYAAKLTADGMEIWLSEYAADITVKFEYSE